MGWLHHSAMYFVPPNCALKNSDEDKFSVMCILQHQQKSVSATREGINELADGSEEITQNTAQRAKDTTDVKPR